jgi:hypothetical protein
MASMSMTDKLGGVIATAIKSVLTSRDARIEQQNAEIKQRLAVLEQRPIVKDAGVWTHGQTYTPGDIVSHGGSGWICRGAHYSTGSEPDHAHFRLLVKHGKDLR